MVWYWLGRRELAPGCAEERLEELVPVRRLLLSMIADLHRDAPRRRGQRL
jgi:hypothetical protein